MARRFRPPRPVAQITHLVPKLSTEVFCRTKTEIITYVFISFKQMVEKIQSVLVIRIH
jgi:hypothetical protein